MKKSLLLILVSLLVSLPVGAIELNTSNVTSQQYIQNHGYSPEVSRLIDLQKSQINDTPITYKSTDPDWYTKNKKVNFIRRVFMYFDCGLDNGDFGRTKLNTMPRYDDL
jgi:hypothetical protein